ncbi:hypothetical protein [Burkholderia cenocepacia]|uniref:hypothetical protein n=1 Tax=Burkholderia cenocepacia TaxID=95486 RepID=UPI001B945B99|nr:hypothetical protein [Burkholderia cenocepacia]MBR8097692.1 hypothetical protein [Burkholderia cenocepacia]MDI9683531.1 hypothetical protein [Burkholderia cenocepacia]HEP6427772.1 hypothetical protein [Burkholderia cenocepacia]
MENQWHWETVGDVDVGVVVGWAVSEGARPSGRFDFNLKFRDRKTQNVVGPIYVRNLSTAKDYSTVAEALEAGRSAGANLAPEIANQYFNRP